MGDPLTLQNAGGEDVFVGATLIDPGATAGQVLTVQSDKTIAAAGGGSQPVNWCLLAVNMATLTVASPGGPVPVGDLTIREQSGSDFSLETLSGAGALLSAAGGRFQAAWGISNEPDATLDSGSTAPRFVQTAFGVGPPGGIGFVNSFVAVQQLNDGAELLQFGGATYASAMGYVAPGGGVLQQIAWVLQGGFGTDSVPSNYQGNVISVWQV